MDVFGSMSMIIKMNFLILLYLFAILTIFILLKNLTFKILNQLDFMLVNKEKPISKFHKNAKENFVSLIQNINTHL